MKRIIYLMMALICAASINAQVRIGNNTEPHKGAVLDLQSTETAGKGVLLPQVELTSLTVFAPVAGTATEGMLVYNIGNAVDKGLYIWDGSSWSKVSGGDESGNGGGSVTSDCGAWINEAKTEWLYFQCYNLGATNNGAPFTPAAAIHGAKYIWGASTPILIQSVDQANASTPSGWTTPIVNADGSWLDDIKTINDPCPNGWRVPTQSQWRTVITNNTVSHVGTWTNSATNYSSGINIGDKLFLPTAGARNNNGVQAHRGIQGYYWSTTIGGTASAWFLDFGGFYVGMDVINGYVGLPVRCVADN